MIPFELLVTGFICKYETRVLQIRTQPTVLLDGSKVDLDAWHLYLGKWEKIPPFIVELEALTSITVSDRALLMANGFMFPLPTRDPLLLSMMNDQRFKEIIRALVQIVECTKQFGSSLADTEKDDLFTFTQDIEMSMVSNPTVFQLVCEIYAAIGTHQSLRHLVAFRDEGRSLGGYLDALTNEALLKMKEMDK